MSETLLAFPASKILGVLSPAKGGTGINNGTNTISVAGAFATIGDYPLTLNLTGATSLTLPASGTLATVAQIPAAAVTSVTQTARLTLNSGVLAYNDSGYALTGAVNTFTQPQNISSSQSVLRLTINCTFSSPNSGILLQETGNSRWTLASYNGGEFTFYNESIQAEALGISASNVATWSAACVFNNTAQFNSSHTQTTTNAFTSGVYSPFQLKNTYNQSGTASYVSLAITDTITNQSSGVTNYGLLYKVGSTTMHSVDNKGNLTVAGYIAPGSINTATTMGTAPGIVFDQSGGANSGHYMGWTGSAWKQLDN